MLYEEAQWVGKVLIEKTMEGNRILNLGSSTLDSRTKLQPHMEEFIFAPLRDKNVQVVHSDITFDEGVDLQGDFTDPAFIAQLKNMQFDGVMCCNLLEHLEDRSLLISVLKEIIPSNGWLLLTVPKQYPYHLDPIDTMYRPTPSELCLLFPEFEPLLAEEVIARRQIGSGNERRYHKNYHEQLRENPNLFARLVMRTLLPFYKFKMWKITVNDLKTRMKPFSVSCVFLSKKQGEF
jgi:SAM-dependent methyltransferase